ncbi:MAG: phosphoribosyl-ATP diphosphatase [Lacunisphaera sp.]
MKTPENRLEEKHRPRARHRAGRQHAAGAHARLHGRGRAEEDAAHQEGHVLQPLEAAPLDQGRVLEEFSAPGERRGRLRQRYPARAAHPDGPTCHRGTVSCFGDAGPAGAGFLAHLDEVVAARLRSGDKSSYTVRLVQEGIARVAQKVGEEGVETALAAMKKDNKEFAGEAADLLYHLIVLLRAKKLSLADAVAVLEQRHAPKK